MTPSLALLDGVRWHGEQVPGDRVAALLCALALHPAGVSDERLVEEIWADEAPANPVKALQVLVSRVRDRLGADALGRTATGYRLDLPVDEVDLLLLHRLRADAEAGLAAGDPAAAAMAASALAMADAAVDPGSDSGPRADLFADVRRQHAGLVRTHALALAASGSGEALAALASAHEAQPDDVPVLAALLRAEAAMRGASAALERYERFRAGLADRLGVDPDPVLRRVHQELLAADSPIRTGLRYDADELLGRESDLAGLRAALASGRLTTVLGPGGIGKTRIAMVLAREANLPRVHVVELVGVASGDDLIAEVGAVLGVRGSLTSRKALTAAQEADVRARIAQELDQGPTLLVLDNCEHVLEAAASLVAYLLVTTRDLTVLTTSRAPLRIAAERAVPLSLLEPVDAAALFERRARAVRPDAELERDAVAAVVDRLDGLPLAIEIAAARVRTMSVEEIGRRLDDRFALLRSRDRGLPERHRTLSAVIEWSWDLLADEERTALATLSVFQDGFDAEAVEAMLGAGGADLVETLVEHSLVVVTEADGAVRMRMLETIREFAALRLAEAGGRDQALHAQQAWATALVTRLRPALNGPGQLGSVAALRREENNLTDVLRRALTAYDAPLVVTLVAALGLLWTMTGEHARIFAVVDGVEPLLLDWDPPEEALPDAQGAAALLLIHLSWLPGRPLDRLRERFAGWGVPEEPWARTAYAMFVEAADDPVPALEALAESAPDRTVRETALIWASIASENQGDATAAAAFAQRGLEAVPATPYLEASLHSQLAQLAMVMGDHRAAARHAEIAWPVLLRLHALDDARSLRLYTAMEPLLEGDDEACERILDEVDAMGDPGQIGSRMVALAARAELALVRGRVDDGLDAYDVAVASVHAQASRGQAMAVGPWLMLAVSGALVAHVRHGRSPRHAVRARELRDLLVGEDAAGASMSYFDLPLNGVLVAAVGAWSLRFGTDAERDSGVVLLATAQRWSYNRSLPSMAWAPLKALAERLRPDRLDALLEEYAGRPGHDLVPQVRELLGRLTSSA